MHLPSDEIFRELQAESSGIWFVPTKGQDTHAILLKSSSPVLKSIIRGSQVKLGISICNMPSGNILMSAVYVYDDHSAPAIMLGPHITLDQQIALREILRDRISTPIFFYDELSRNVAEAQCIFHQHKDEIINLLGTVDDLYAGDVNEDVVFALDHFESIAEAVISEDPLKTKYISVAELTLVNFVDFDLYTVGNLETFKYRITDADEGGGLEQSVWHLLIDLFQDNIYRSPLVVEGKNMRELTDVMALSEFGIFIFESKSLAILSTTKGQSTARRAKNIESHIKKALSQLVGATKAIRNGRDIYSSGGKKIDFDRNVIPHGIVLISEMFPAVDWKATLFELAQAMLKTRAILHIIDLQELARLVMGSKTANILDHYLMQRANKVIELQNVMVRVNFIKDEHDIKS